MLDTSELFEAVGGNRQEQPDKDIIERFRLDDSFDVPIELTDLELWANYINEDLYVMDKKLREFFKKTRYAREKKGGYKTTASVVFAWIYGRQPRAEDGAACRMLHELLRYYCTSFTGPTTFMGKKVTLVYEFSKYSTYNKRPYSLKLRLEECDDGKNPWRKRRDAGKAKRRNGRRKHSEDGPSVDG